MPHGNKITGSRSTGGRVVGKTVVGGLPIISIYPPKPSSSRKTPTPPSPMPSRNPLSAFQYQPAPWNRGRR